MGGDLEGGYIDLTSSRQYELIKVLECHFLFSVFLLYFLDIYSKWVGFVCKKSRRD